MLTSTTFFSVPKETRGLLGKNKLRNLISYFPYFCLDNKQDALKIIHQEKLVLSFRQKSFETNQLQKIFFYPSVVAKINYNFSFSFQTMLKMVT